MTNLFLRKNELFPGSDTVRKYSFDAIFLRNNSALLARANHILAMNFASTRGQSALFQEKIVLNACRQSWFRLPLSIS